MTAWVASLRTFREARRDAAVARLGDATGDSELFKQALVAAEDAVSLAWSSRAALLAQGRPGSDIHWQQQRLLACDALIDRLRNAKKSALERWIAADHRRVELSREVASCERSIMKVGELAGLLDSERRRRDARLEQADEEDLAPSHFRLRRGK